MRHRPMVVAFVEVESPQMRQLRHAVSGADTGRMVADARRPPWVNVSRWDDGPPEFAFWCAADKPSGELDVAPIHRTTRVPAMARCEECGVGIRELQAELTEALAGVSSTGRTRA